jgi:hypothetical protein
MKRIFSLTIALMVLASVASAQDILSDTAPRGSSLQLRFAPSVDTRVSDQPTPYIAPKTSSKTTKEKELELNALGKKSMFDTLDGEDSRFDRVRRNMNVRSAQAIPEPGTMIALGTGAAIFFARRRKSKAAK